MSRFKPFSRNLPPGPIGRLVTTLRKPVVGQPHLALEVPDEPHSASLRNVLLHPTSRWDHNQRDVLIDGIGVGLVAGVSSFLSVFLVRLGASNFMVGLLTAMPALTGILLAMPMGEFLAGRSRIVPWFARSRFFVLSCYMLTGLVPFLFHNHLPEVIIVIWAIATLPQVLVGVAFTVLIGAVSEPTGRLTLLSRRWSIFNLTSALAVLAVGYVLKLFEFPFNYQVVFIGSFAGALISLVFSSSIKLPPLEKLPPHRPLIRTLRQHASTLRANRQFTHFTLSQFVFRWGMALALPLFPIYWVRNVNASDPAIGIINSVQTAMMVGAYFLWTWTSRRRGKRPVLLITCLGLSFYPLLTALTHGVEWLVVWAGMAGLFVAGMNLMFFDTVLSTCPVDEQPAYIGMYQTTVYIALFLAPLVGTTLADVVGIVPALILGTVLRLAGFGLMVVLGVGKVEHGRIM